jgi:hypothetical protein
MKEKGVESEGLSHPERDTVATWSVKPERAVG